MSEEFNSILEAIQKTGSTSIEEAMTKHKINVNKEAVLNRSSGLPRIQPNIAKKAKLILSQPSELREVNKYLVRCCVCNNTITYPAWYYSVRYAVNHFHYFVCFDENSPSKPTTSCYRRD